MTTSTGTVQADSVREDDTSARNNMNQLIQLRWIAVFGQIATISVANFWLGIPLPLDIMFGALAGLTAFNALSVLRLRSLATVTNAELFLALLVDVGMLTVQLYLSGGAANPFIFLFLLQVSLGAVLLQSWSAWVMAGVTACCFAGLAITAQPLSLPPEPPVGLTNAYLLGALLCFLINAALLVIFIGRINGNLRNRDSRLADLRQRAAEEEHIVRMGLLASGAAHELGTPLATLAVILGDWKRMPNFTGDPELLQEVCEMETQVLRCKAIVSGILLSAGEARGDAPIETTMRTFLDSLVDEWKATRPTARFVYQNRFGQDMRIVSDTALKQMICNVLDNALEASPGWVGLTASRVDDSLRLVVTDAGPGFEPEILNRLGKPYQSTKGRPGGGLGLFLVANVARTLGGSVSASNAEGGGAVVTLTLPLAALTLEHNNESIHGS